MAVRLRVALLTYASTSSLATPCSSVRKALKEAFKTPLMGAARTLASGPDTFPDGLAGRDAVGALLSELPVIQSSSASASPMKIMKCRLPCGADQVVKGYTGTA
jgi:hypothetical protein